jgi:hypothetical protein
VAPIKVQPVHGFETLKAISFSICPIVSWSWGSPPPAGIV